MRAKKLLSLLLTVALTLGVFTFAPVTASAATTHTFKVGSGMTHANLSVVSSLINDATVVAADTVIIELYENQTTALTVSTGKDGLTITVKGMNGVKTIAPPEQTALYFNSRVNVTLQDIAATGGSYELYDLAAIQPAAQINVSGSTLTTGGTVTLQGADGNTTIPNGAAGIALAGCTDFALNGSSGLTIKGGNGVNGGNGGPGVQIWASGNYSFTGPATITGGDTSGGSGIWAPDTATGSLSLTNVNLVGGSFTGGGQPGNGLNAKGFDITTNGTVVASGGDGIRCKTLDVASGSVNATGTTSGVTIFGDTLKIRSGATLTAKGTAANSAGLVIEAPVTLDCAGKLFADGDYGASVNATGLLTIDPIPGDIYGNTMISFSGSTAAFDFTGGGDHTTLLAYGDWPAGADDTWKYNGTQNPYVLPKSWVGPLSTYTLTVVNGTDTTNAGPYTASTQVNIAAGVAPTGQVFDYWSSDNGGTFGNASSANTTFAMPVGNTTVTAHYKSSGSGDSDGGSYTPPAPTVPIGGVDLPYTKDADGGVTVKPTEKQIKDIINNTDGGNIVFDFSGVSGVTALYFELDPSWFDNTGKSVTFCFGGYSFTIPDGMFHLVYELTDGKVRFSVSVGSVSVSISQDGKEIDWYNYACPMTVSMPSVDGTVMVDTATGNIIPRSWAKDGVVYAKVYKTGTYDAKAAVVSSFTDTAGLWMDEAVSYMAVRGIIAGVGDHKFAPGQNVTRGQFVTMLMRMVNIEPQGQWMVQQFSDAEAGAYYYDALLKAKALGLVSGIGDNKFAPDAEITRQDMFVMLYRAMEKLGMISPSEGGMALREFGDYNEVAQYAEEALLAFVQDGLVSGKGNNLLDPRGTATRAEAAQVLYNVLARDAK